jgi:hypothetical protein
MLDSRELKKFVPVINSPMWARFEHSILEPELEAAHKELETAANIEAVRGKIKFIRMLLELRKNAAFMKEEKE